MCAMVLLISFIHADNEQANLAMLLLILFIEGITAGLSLRGKIPITMMVALGAFVCMMSSIALIPPVMSATFTRSPSAGTSLPMLFVPASRTMIFGWTPSSSAAQPMRKGDLFCLIVLSREA
jgi:hypothetical protein